MRTFAALLIFCVPPTLMSIFGDELILDFTRALVTSTGIGILMPLVWAIWSALEVLVGLCLGFAIVRRANIKLTAGLAFTLCCFATTLNLYRHFSQQNSLSPTYIIGDLIILAGEGAGIWVAMALIQRNTRHPPTPDQGAVFD